MIDSLAILPVVNASGDDNLEYLSDGITESLINSLSQLPQLRVMARGTVFSYKGREVDPRKVGAELKVHAVEEITRQISERLRLKLSGAEQLRVTKRHTENPEAYQLYLKGRYYSNQWTTEGLKKGIEYLNRAVEADPAYALAHAGLSASYFDASNIVFSPDEALPKVKAAALRALQLDETIAEAQRLDPESWAPFAFITHTHAVWGKRDEARRELDELKRIEKQKHVDP